IMYRKMIVSFLVVTLAVANAGIPGVKLGKRVVAGMNYIFTVKLGRTNCKKGGVETLCAIHKDPKCKITVWSQPWLNFLKRQ
uniref:Cystatin domain-containing protein n=1 Tax=Sinocyclocheilus rhinocerous TaxID=307959 RepID=A0A673GE81_9TELE